MKRKKIGALSGTAAAVIGGLAMSERVGGTPLTLTGIGAFSESNTFTASTYTNTDPTPGSVSFPHIISREYLNAGAFEIVPCIRIELGSIPAGSQITGAQLGLFFTDSTYYGGNAGRQEYIDLWAVKDAFTPTSVNMTTYDGSNLWTDGFRAGINHILRTGPEGSFLSTVWPTGSAPGGTPSSKLNNEADEYKIWSSDQLDNYLTTQHNLGLDAYLQLTHSGSDGFSYRFVATGDDNDTFGPHYAADHQPVLSFDYAPLVPKWRKNDSGDWSTAANWFGKVVPSGIDKEAEFGSWTDVANVNYPQGSIAVMLDTARTVGKVTFDSPETYNITGTNALTLDVTTGSAAIDVLNGSQVISAPVALNKNTTVTVSASAPSLTISGDLTAASGVTMTKAGGGILEVKNVRMPGVAVTGGTVLVTQNGGNTGTSKVATVAASGGGKLDVVDNDLVVTGMSVGSWNGSVYTDVLGLVAEGRNGGVWDGPGITTSMTDATSGSGYTMLGVASATEARGIGPTDTDTWSGQTVTGTDTLVMYTYGGDANLSGNVDVDDYGQIDFNASTGGALTGWFNGDFDYNGFQDVDDYGIIDFVINIQGPPLGNSGGAISSVPEPASMTMLLLAGAGLAARRRRQS